jgi:hypothetical protein
MRVSLYLVLDDNDDDNDEDEDEDKIMRIVMSKRVLLLF